ncbi:MAG: serine hydrolase [Streptosporangiaceae bacterium]
MDGPALLLDRRLEAYLARRSGQLSVSATDLATGRSYTYAPGLRTAAASIVKADILAALLLRAQRAGRSLNRTERSLAASMIIRSDNRAASALFRTIGGASGLRTTNERLGLEETVPAAAWGATTTSARDQVRLMIALTAGTSPLRPGGRKYGLGLMSRVVAGQDWGVGAAARAGDAVALKNGWLPRQVDGGCWTINSVGRVRGTGRDLLIGIVSRRNSSMSAGITTVEHVARTVADALGEVG